jgi:hypothetical protein
MQLAPKARFIRQHDGELTAFLSVTLVATPAASLASSKVMFFQL